MELILWRHADAENGKEDAKRALTEKGRKQAARIARWLKPRIGNDWLMLSSPAVRAQQTAEALGTRFDTRVALGTGASPDAILREAHWPDGARNVIIVGHQPTLGQVAAQLLTGQSDDLGIKKGAVWWFSSKEGLTLRAVMAPDLTEGD
jgi:phosphohistidine phosphatase